MQCCQGPVCVHKDCSIAGNVNTATGYIGMSTCTNWMNANLGHAFNCLLLGLAMLTDVCTVKRLYFVGCKFHIFHDFHFNRKIYFIENQRFAMPRIDSPKIAKITFANHVLQASSRNI